MSTTLAIITPIIHRNGDTRDTLLDQLKQAYSAVRDAMDALQSCAGNGKIFIQTLDGWNDTHVNIVNDTCI